MSLFLFSDFLLLLTLLVCFFLFACLKRVLSQIAFPDKKPANILRHKTILFFVYRNFNRTNLSAKQFAQIFKKASIENVLKRNVFSN